MNSLAKTSKKTLQERKSLFTHAKVETIREQLEKLSQRFPSVADLSIFKELDRMAANLEDDFIHQRSIHQIARLAYSIAWIRKKISQEMTLLPLKDRYDVRLMPATLHFTFGSKPVLGILVHGYLRDKYESLDEEHIFLTIKKLIPEVQLVKGSIYAFQPSKNTIKTLYFEIDKRSGLPFNFEDLRRLKELLRQEIKFCVEQLVPLMFMTRNEEEVLRNILTLSREIDGVFDLPQIMILFDRQTSQEVIFTIILVRVCQQKELKISELFTKVQGNFTYFPERCQIVRYHKKKYPIEANVFRISLRKDPSLLRADLSLNFYLARQKISNLLIETIGEFRDFNGGIILKQRQWLNSFIEAFPEIALQNSDLLESFFYSLSPIETQAILPLKSLKDFFQLFLEATQFNIAKQSDYFLKFVQISDQLFVMIRISERTLKEAIEQLLPNLKLAQSRVVTSSLNLQNTHVLGYFIEAIPSLASLELQEALTKTLVEWKQKVESLKILKLGLTYPVVSLDPRIGGDQISSLILKMLSEGLMRENKEGNIEYGVAKAVEISSDLKTYLFKLRATRWSDGSLVTAFDFEYAWKKVLSPNFKTPFAYLFYPIKNAQLAKKGVVSQDAIGIQALDELTLKVELKSPTPYFLELTAHTMYSPVPHLIDQLNPNWPLEKGKSYICNGGFQLTKNSPNEGYNLTKNPLYWDAKNIKLDQIIILMINRYQACEMFQKNTNDWIGLPLLAWEDDFIPKENDERVNFVSKSVYWYTFNSEKPPFNNKKMRQALSLAVNREEIATLFNTQPAITPLPITHSLVQHSSLSQFNPQQAKILFDQAIEELSLSKEDFPLLTLIYLAGNVRKKLAEMVKKSWEESFNIRCTIEALEWNDLFTRITEGDYQIGGIAWHPWVNDPMYTLDAFRDPKESINFSKWGNTKYQEILRLAEKETDLQKRRGYYLEAEEVLLDEMPVAPIFSSPSHALKKKNLKVNCFSNLINFKWADFV